MEKLKIAFPDFWGGHFKKENIFLLTLQKYFDVAVDEENPDVIIYSIYNERKDAPKYKCKKILYCLENYRPSAFGTDYAFSITHEPHSDKNFRLPHWQFYLILNPESKDKLFNKTQHDSFDRFCSFTVSNGGCFTRNAILQQLNSYKRVHSYGKFMNNTNELQKIDTDFWREGKDEFFSKVSHKFSIAYENSPSKYWVTEKIMDAFLAGSLPIYWGALKVTEDFNEKAFINANKISGENLFNLIKTLDNDKQLFNEIYDQPVFTNEQKTKVEENLINFENFLINAIKN